MPNIPLRHPMTSHKIIQGGREEKWNGTPSLVDDQSENWRELKHETPCALY